MISGPSPNSAAALNPTDFQTVASKKVKPEPTPSPAVATDYRPAASAEEASPNPDEARGVIRLLLEGHFKGVADVRLRLNFNDELQALESGPKEEMVQGEVNAFDAAVTEQVQSFLGSRPEDVTDDEAAANELNALRDAISTFNAAKDKVSSDPVIDLSARFDQLASTIRSFIPQPSAAVEEIAMEPPDAVVVPTAASDEEPVVTDVTTEAESIEPPITEAASAEGTSPGSPIDWNALIQDLEGMYDGFRTELNEKTASFSILPELSPPTGQGKAYDKFLNAYQELKNTSTDTESQPSGVNALI